MRSWDQSSVVINKKFFPCLIVSIIELKHSYLFDNQLVYI